MRNRLLVLFLIVSSLSYGQELKTEDWSKYFERNPLRHSIAFMSGFVVVPNTLESDSSPGSRVLFVGMIGIDYKYRISEKFSAGLIYELELGSYSIKFEEAPVPRENVQVLTAFLGYEILEGLEVFAGAGFEFDINHNYWLFKVGFEYEALIANDWYFAPELTYNQKEEVYRSFNIAIHWRKKFGKALAE